jgi:hypothetical protein
LTTEKFKSDVAALRLNKDLKKLMMANNGKKNENPVWATKPQVFDYYSVENQKVCKLVVKNFANLVCKLAYLYEEKRDKGRLWETQFRKTCGVASIILRVMMKIGLTPFSSFLFRK